MEVVLFTTVVMVSRIGLAAAYDRAGDSMLPFVVDDPYDSPYAVRGLDGSSMLRTTDDSAMLIPQPDVEDILQSHETAVDDSLLNVLLAVNGLDHSLLTLSRGDVALLQASGMPKIEQPTCDTTGCHRSCALHRCSGGFCDKFKRCRCFCS